MSDWIHARGTRGVGPWETVIDASAPGWAHTGLRIAQLDGHAVPLDAGAVERIIVPLSGSFEVRIAEDSVVLHGRSNVFQGPTDVLYLGIDTAASVLGHGRVAVAEAPASERLPSAYLPRDGVPVEMRGTGTSTRQVHNFGVPGVLAAQKLIVCEVITPAGNWSSYPPHKHDEITETESRLEEIYYFEAAGTRGAPAPADCDPFGLFASYSSPNRHIDITTMVRTGDVALVPHGYHGPAAAPPGYDLYYLNVMAGPDAARVWKISDDPHHAWIRDTWAEQPPDPRLPYRAKERTP